MIIKLIRFLQFTSDNEGLQFINRLIEVTDIDRVVKERKTKYAHASGMFKVDGTLGSGY